MLEGFGEVVQVEDERRLTPVSFSWAPIAAIRFLK